MRRSAQFVGGTALVVFASSIASAALTVTAYGGDPLAAGTAAYTARTTLTAQAETTAIDFQYISANKNMIDVNVPLNNRSYDLRFTAYAAGTGSIGLGGTNYTSEYNAVVTAANAGMGLVTPRWSADGGTPAGYNQPTGLNFASSGVNEGDLCTNPNVFAVWPGQFAAASMSIGTFSGPMGYAPISGTNGAYTLRTNIDEIGIGVGGYDSNYGVDGEHTTFTVYVFDTAGNYLDKATYTPTTADLDRAYFTISNPGGSIGAVVLKNSMGGAYGALTFDAHAAVPEPATAALLGLTGLAMLARRRRA